MSTPFAMRVGLIVDSACDLPYEFRRKHDLFILPVTAVIDGQTYVDTHDPVRTQEFYQSGLLQKGHHAETRAFTTEQIYSLFMEQIVTQFDIAICETVTRSRSQIFQNATEAMNAVMANYEQARAAAGRTGKFSMRVIDSKQIFAGQGLLAAHTLRLIGQKLSKNALRHEVETFTDRIYTCVIPRDLHYIREPGPAPGRQECVGAGGVSGQGSEHYPGAVRPGCRGAAGGQDPQLRGGGGKGDELRHRPGRGGIADPLRQPLLRPDLDGDRGLARSEPAARRL